MAALKTRLDPRLVMVAAFAVAAWSAGARAQYVGVSPRAAAMAYSVRALGLGTAALYFNPAGMAQIRQYAIDLGYGLQGALRLHDFHVSVVDSQTNRRVAAGVGYTYSQSSKGGVNLKQHDVRAGLAIPFQFGDTFASVGATFRYLAVRGSELVGVVSPGNTATLDVGLVMGFAKMFYIGICGQNLVDPSATHAPRSLGVGLGFTYFNVDADIDLVVDFSRRPSAVVSPSFGVEYVVKNVVALRSGFWWDRVPQRTRKVVTGGFGYISRYVGVDVAYGHNVSQRDDYFIEASLRVFLP